MIEKEKIDLELWRLWWWLYAFTVQLPVIIDFWEFYFSYIFSIGYWISSGTDPNNECTGKMFSKDNMTGQGNRKR